MSDSSGNKTLDRNYRWYLYGNFSSTVGIWTQRTAIMWLTWEMTKSPSWLGVIALAETGPTIALGLYAGVVLDRLTHIGVLRFTQLLTLTYTIVLFTLTVTGLINIWLLTALVLFRGCVNAFNRPARQTVVYNLAGRDNLMKALAQNAMIFQTSKVIGPAIGGLTMVAFGASGTFAICIALVLAFTFSLRMLEVPVSARPAREPKRLVTEVADGLRYILSQPAVRNQFVLLAVVALCAKPITELMPGFASGVFGEGVGALAWLLGCHGAGASLAGIWMSLRFGVQSLLTMACIAIITMATALILFVGVNSFYIGCLLMLVFGFSAVVMDISSQTLVQSTIRSRFRGRTMSIYGMIAQGGPAVGALILGHAAETAGLRWPIFVAAVVALIAGALALTFRSKISGPPAPPQAETL